MPRRAKALNQAGGRSNIIWPPGNRCAHAVISDIASSGCRYIRSPSAVMNTPSAVPARPRAFTWSTPRSDCRTPTFDSGPTPACARSAYRPTRSAQQLLDRAQIAGGRRRPVALLTHGLADGAAERRGARHLPVEHAVAALNLLLRPRFQARQFVEQIGIADEGDIGMLT